MEAGKGKGTGEGIKQRKRESDLAPARKEIEMQ